MADLIVLDLPGGPGFVTALRAVWDAGHAAMPVDQRLPPAAKRRLLTAMEPAAVIDAENATPSRLPGEARPVADGDALVMATSGTTGEPKGVVLTHRAVVAHARAVHRFLSVDPGRDRWLACLPLAHVGGLGVVTRALVTGTPLTVLDGFDAATVAAQATGARPATLVSLVPTALERVDVRRYRWVVLGGSADSGQRPANVVRTYGLTETGGGIVYGDRPLDGVEIRVVDDEIEVRGPMLLRAYRDGTDPKDPQGWLATADVGRVEADGTVTVHGRRGDLIITGGENVWPEPVEAALAAHPSVAEVAVVGRADAEWGTRVVAFVVPRNTMDPPTLAALRDQVKATMPPFAAPRELVLVASLPRTALGKVRRDDLA